MNRFLQFLQGNPMILPVISLLMLIPALFINLGLMPLISDEPTRAIVTLEMIISGNYVTPTINGEFYYNKPPLFNWILSGFIRLSGRQDEFIFRLPTVISLVLTGLVIFLFSKKVLGKFNALLAALMLITSARILFWDSFQGLIDITYSLITFTSFAVLYHYTARRKFLLMFLLTYLLTATGYMMKGLPSLAFQGISLIGWLWYAKEFRKLFTWQHLAGIGIFLLITGTYYFVYLQSNSLQDVFATLFDQSNRINQPQGTLLSWIGHLFVFPLQMSYEFAPWTLFLLLLIRRDVRRKILADDFIRFCLLIFASNIVIYWISADMRPRYLFMLFPLLFMILVKAYHEAGILNTGVFRLFNRIFPVLAFAGTLSLLVYPFWNETSHISGVWYIVPALFLFSLTASVLSVKMPAYRLWLFILVMLTVRTGFNIFNLPARYVSYPDAGYRQGAIEAARLSEGLDLYILGSTPFNHDASFYISRERMQIVKRTNEIFNKQACYITDKKNLANFAPRMGKYEICKQFTIKLDETKLYLVKSK